MRKVPRQYVIVKCVLAGDAVGDPVGTNTEKVVAVQWAVSEAQAISRYEWKTGNHGGYYEYGTSWSDISYKAIDIDDYRKQ